DLFRLFIRVMRNSRSKKSRHSSLQTKVISMRNQSTFLAVSSCILATLITSTTYAHRGRDRGRDRGNDRLTRFLDQAFAGKQAVQLSTVDSRTRGLLTRLMQEAGVKGDVVTRSLLNSVIEKRREADAKK